MEKKKEALKVSIYAQKGGVGKSTMTILLASVLHYRLGYNIVVLDCDFPQHSLLGMRERDKRTIMESDFHKRLAVKQFHTINKKAYPIIKCKAENALEKAFDYCESSSVQPDIIFFDLPGTANTQGVIGALKGMNYIFSPITADRLVVESTLAFSEVFLKLPAQNKNALEQSLFLFWNLVDGREKTNLYNSYQTVIEGLSLKSMATRIMDSKRFRKEMDDTGSYVFKSTLLPADLQILKATRVDEFVKEFLKIIHI
ncbi:conjugal transfer protein TraA [Chryseobacterium lactis]|uniref:Conjugal transfer protein TraA n=1 Tax=Chryseobacterium lactis TaxID=1241981 RepID=A0A3G6RDC5_CHRLC|nr:P-loop NTPase [Chryseobacterium lactis]AZA82403.1 ParA family protein [Chryseobacterium lactis]AZB02785.1 ParA family protein [Chryseobacterium lactis]PNW13921.1 conjugal transfer protein TraA [Chryseobacterium lactis]